MGNTGYTLIEMVVVLMLVAILAAIAWPALQVGLDRFVLVDASWHLAGEIRQAQQQAVVKEEPFRIKFQPSLGRCDITHFGETWAIYNLPDGINIENTSFRHGEVIFYPTGAPSMGGTVTLANGRGEKRYVKVTVGAGRVRVTKEL